MCNFRLETRNIYMNAVCTYLMSARDAFTTPVSSAHIAGQFDLIISHDQTIGASFLIGRNQFELNRAKFAEQSVELAGLQFTSYVTVATRCTRVMLHVKSPVT